MTRNTLRIAAAGGCLAALSFPAAAQDYTDTAPVISVQPIVERVSAPREQCYNETVQTAPQVVQETRREGGGVNPAGAIIGGIAGGVLGHQIGGGRGRDAATVLGAVGGAVAGNEIAGGSLPGRTVTEQRVYQGPPQTVQRCQTVSDYREEIRGYRVTYRYAGRDITTTMDRDPGPRVRVAVGVVDAQRGAAYR